MKSPTTMLAERAAQPAPADGLKLYRDAAEAQIGGPVLEACLFSRPASYGADALASHSGLIVGLALRKARKVRAGGLPQHFLLAVTDHEVIALERRIKARRGASPAGEPGLEVARWPRAGLGVTWRDGGYLYKVTIESSSEPTKVECCVGKHPLSESFLELMAGPAESRRAA